MRPLSQAEILHYSRHLLLPQIGMAGQIKLKEASVLIVGTGGLGSPVSMYLAAAGVGYIGLVDYDVVDYSNLQRQIVHGHASLGESKVVSARRRLLDINPDIQITPYDEPFTAANTMQLLADHGQNGYDVLVDCSDNFATRYLTNDVCVLSGKPNVFGAIFRFDGQASVFDARRGPCYRCLFPEPPPPGTVMPCGESGVLGVLPGTIGTIQATETIKLLLGIGEPLIGRLMLYSALDMTFDFVKLHKNPACAICGEHPTITALIDYEAFCGAPAQGETGVLGAEWDITPAQLAERLKSGKVFALVDLRDAQEREISRLSGTTHTIPFGELAQRLGELDKEGEIVVFCRAGRRSSLALELLVRAGFKHVRSLRGGINAWAREVDGNVAVY